MSKHQAQFREAPLPLFDHRPGFNPEGRSTSSHDDSELLSALLAIDDRIVDDLISTFGGFNRVLAAPVSQLRLRQGVSSETAQTIKRLEAVGHRMVKTDALVRDVISSWDQLLKYCRVRLAHRDQEEFHVLFLDRQNRLIDTKCMAVGTVDHVPVYPREVFKSALELNASALILVHNHPSGLSSASQADIEMTQTIAAGAEALSIHLHDHVVIGTDEPFSFRSHGLLRPI